MFKYPIQTIPEALEPEYPHVDEVVVKGPLPSEGEIRYLGNAYNYCNPLIAELTSCVEQGVLENDELLFKRCNSKLEALHHCFSWREPADHGPAFAEETKPCLWQRDLFLKCYFKQAAPWQECEIPFNSLYRCLYRAKPSFYNIN
mmetsp:Transcript_1132/g.2736  ORF Transcript_1132/g.2736 Transcript_1132/m.2736 type:complete len:145 (+) Transcript_1132:512-946(+)